MAEIRTHDPSEGNPISQALRAAMGEPVRPVAPGAKTPPRSEAGEAPASQAPPPTSWRSLSFTTRSIDEPGE